MSKKAKDGKNTVYIHQYVKKEAEQLPEKKLTPILYKKDGKIVKVYIPPKPKVCCDSDSDSSECDCNECKEANCQNEYSSESSCDSSECHSERSCESRCESKCECESRCEIDCDEMKCMVTSLTRFPCNKLGSAEQRW